MFGSVAKSMRDNYVVEIIMMAVIAYLFASFVYLSFDFSTWPVAARAIVAAAVLAVIGFSQYVSAHKVGRS